MKIITWNIAYTNRNIVKSLNHLMALDAEIICLQELNLKGLEYLKSLGIYNLFYVKDCIGDVKGNDLYLAILSKFPFKNQQLFTYSANRINSLWNRGMKRFFKIQEAYDGQYVDMLINNKEVRLFNVHLSWATGPTRRIAQFKNVLTNYDASKLNVFCGDFNVFGKLHINFLASIIFGYKFKELFMNERNIFEEIFKTYKLQNIFKGASVWPWLKVKVQLDHILVPEEIAVNSTEITNQTYGSDHRILIADINL